MMDTPRTMAEEAAQLSREIRTVAMGVLVLFFAGAALLGSSQGWETWQLPVLIGLGLFTAGALVGFLFGIPKSASNEATNREDGGAGDHTGQSGLSHNTNLEQISDWLTKIIVGLGLVELYKFAPAVMHFCGVIGPAFHAYADVAPLAVAVYFPVLGFLSGYLMTRLYLSGLIGRADSQLESLRNSPEVKKAVLALQRSLARKTAVELPDEQKAALRATDEALQRKPESTYSLKDWMDRAFAAYAEGEQMLAAAYFAKAAKVPNASAQQKARAIFNQAIIEDKMGHFDEALAAYDDVIGQTKDTREPTMKTLAAAAMLNKGVLLRRCGHADQGLKTDDELISHFKDDRDPEIRKRVAAALINKGVALEKLERWDAASVAYDEAIERLLRADDSSSQKNAIVAIGNKGELLGRIGKYEESIAEFDKALERFGKTTDVGVRNRLVQVVFDRAVTLHGHDRESGIRAMKELVAQESSSFDASARGFVSKAQEYLRAPESQWQYIDVIWDKV